MYLKQSKFYMGLIVALAAIFFVELTPVITYAADDVTATTESENPTTTVNSNEKNQAVRDLQQAKDLLDSEINKVPDTNTLAPESLATYQVNLAEAKEIKREAETLLANSSSTKEKLDLLTRRVNAMTNALVKTKENLEISNEINLNKESLSVSINELEAVLGKNVDTNNKTPESIERFNIFKENAKNELEKAKKALVRDNISPEELSTYKYNLDYVRSALVQSEPLILKDTRPDAHRFNPKGQDIVVNVGEKVDPLLGIYKPEAFELLPKGTAVVWTYGEPKTDKLLERGKVSISVKYPDGTEDIVYTTLTVKEKALEAYKTIEVSDIILPVEGNNPTFISKIDSVKYPDLSIVDEGWVLLRDDFTQEKVITSDAGENATIPDDEKLTEFEVGRKYMYVVMMDAENKSLYDVNTEVILNGEKADGAYINNDQFLVAYKIYDAASKPLVSKYTVKFNSNGHGIDPNTQNITSGEMVMEPTLKEEGWIFEGWYKEENLKEKFDFDTPITENIVLFAKWTKLETMEEKNTELGDSSFIENQSGETSVDSSALIDESYNKKVSTKENNLPKTGDVSNLSIYIGLMVLTGAGLMVFRQRRKKSA